MNDQTFMARAFALAQRAEAAGEVPVGALVVHNEQIIGEGFNQSITLSDPTAHAEVIAMRAAAKKLGNYRLPNTTLYVTLEPCPMCASALVHARISRLVFGAFDPKTGAAGSVFNLVEDKRLNHQLAVVGGVDEARCSELLKAFFKVRR